MADRVGYAESMSDRPDVAESPPNATANADAESDPALRGDAPAPPFVPYTDDGLIFACTLPGPTPRVQWTDLPRLFAQGPPVWMNLDRMKAHVQSWIRTESGLNPSIAEALLADETRPRAVEREDGMLVILRGVNLHPGAEPDELIALRMWLDPTRILTLRQFRFQTVVALREAAQRGQAPATPGGMLVAIANGLANRLGPVVENLQSLLDDTEDQLAADESGGLDARPLAEVRRQAIRLRRYLAPQRDALMHLASSTSPLLDPAQKTELLEIAQRTARFVEDLEEVRDRAAVTQEELRSVRELRASRTMYLLTLVAAVFLPLGLLTGLLGINVGGMPGADSPWAFWIVTGGLVVVALGLVVAFKKLRWL